MRFYLLIGFGLIFYWNQINGQSFLDNIGRQFGMDLGQQQNFGQQRLAQNNVKNKFLFKR